ncbi:MAG TPA: CPBP family intramembrane glutamic endopeptidase [Caldilineaceae bacterium]|nr:CPBP family intramembrane glutamic endopeptidase [Caldilineaceae bacterium]
MFLLFAYAIAGSAALYLALTGGLTGSPPLRLFLVLSLWYMPAPALAHLLTRWLTGEGWQHLYLRPHLRAGWPWWLIAWFLPALLVIAGAGVYFTLFPQHFDPGLTRLRDLLAQSAAQTGAMLPLSPSLLLVVQTLQAILIAPLLNALPTLGEEFGWRAYLQPKLLPLGWRPAMLWMGLCWGVWHWPILALGYNYGLDYPGAPWLGMLLFLWFTFTVGTLFGWLTARAASVWPAVIGHGALNGIANLPVLVVQGSPNPLLGPLAVGLIGGVGFALAGLYCWLRPSHNLEKP